MLGAVGVTPLSSHTPLSRGGVATALAISPQLLVALKAECGCHKCNVPSGPHRPPAVPLWDTPRGDPSPMCLRTGASKLRRRTFGHYFANQHPSPLPLGHRDSSPKLPCHQGPWDLPLPRLTVAWDRPSIAWYDLLTGGCQVCESVSPDCPQAPLP